MRATVAREVTWPAAVAPPYDDNDPTSNYAVFDNTLIDEPKNYYYDDLSSA